MDRVHRLIVDTDAGIDGAFALLYALLSPQIRVEGITTVHGAAAALQAADSALRLVRLCDPGCEVPVAAGAERPLERPWAGPDIGKHGRNGLGGALLPPADVRPEPGTAAELLVRQANARPGELTLVLTGRATNWALALQLDPSIGGKFRAVVAAGGTVLAPGDATPVAETRFHGDPEAAAALFAAAARLSAVGLDAAVKLLLDGPSLELALRHVPAHRFKAYQLLRRLFDFRATCPLFPDTPIGKVPLHGAAAVLAATSPELFAWREWPAAVDTGSGATAGMVVADRRRFPDLAGARHVRFAMDADADAVLHRFLSVFTG
ncbi:nucleoside hydrolase [Cohnella thermotolerans]|uniref:nucleoside hydrolase n=1 Tax=Cohnella thermotolerans TaxID=329858 RepID=UPI000429B0D7|nr:nucleoside hydrolase [Cohnella thermotolerans]